MQQIALLLGLIFILVLTCAALGYWLSRKLKRDGAILLAGLVVCSMLLFAKYVAESIWIAQLIPIALLPVLGNWMAPLAGVLAGIVWVLSKRPPQQKALFLSLFLVGAILLSHWNLFVNRPVVKDRWYRGVCLQTSSTTCGPAAAATLLHAIGIQATEQEMVQLCRTSSRGTPLNDLLYGLNQKLQGTPWRPRAAWLTDQELFRQRYPSIIFVGIDDGSDPLTVQRQMQWGWIPGVLHTVAHLPQSSDDFIPVGDPATGLEWWSKDTLNSLWRGKAIILQRD